MFYNNILLIIFVVDILVFRFYSLNVLIRSTNTFWCIFCLIHVTSVLRSIFLNLKYVFKILFWQWTLNKIKCNPFLQKLYNWFVHFSSFSTTVGYSNCWVSQNVTVTSLCHPCSTEYISLRNNYWAFHTLHSVEPCGRSHILAQHLFKTMLKIVFQQ